MTTNTQLEALRLASRWLHAAYDRPPQTPEAVAMLRMVDAALASAPAQPVAMTDTFVQPVPDKCDRITWRGQYLHLDTLSAQAAPKVPCPVSHLCDCSETQNPCARSAPELTTCNCRWQGDVQVQQCTLHEAHVDAIHEWAERAKTAEAKAQAVPVGEIGWARVRVDTDCDDDGWCFCTPASHPEDVARGFQDEFNSSAQFFGQVFAAPQPPAPSEQRKPLTDEQIVILQRKTDKGAHAPRSSALAFARAIEAAHGILSTGGDQSCES